MRSSIDKRVVGLERAALGGVRAEWDALWAHFSDAELEVAAGITQEDIEAGVLSAEQERVVDKWRSLGGERLTRRVWELMTPAERAERMREAGCG